MSMIEASLVKNWLLILGRLCDKHVLHKLKAVGELNIEG